MEGSDPRRLAWDACTQVEAEGRRVSVFLQLTAAAGGAGSGSYLQDDMKDAGGWDEEESRL